MIQWIENFTTRRFCNLIVFYHNKILYRVVDDFDLLKGQATETAASIVIHIYRLSGVPLVNFMLCSPFSHHLCSAIFANCFRADAFVVV